MLYFKCNTLTFEHLQNTKIMLVSQSLKHNHLAFKHWCA